MKKILVFFISGILPLVGLAQEDAAVAGEAIASGSNIEMSPNFILFLVGGVIIAGFLGNLIFKVTKIPSVVKLMGIGMLLGPVSGLLDREQLQEGAEILGKIALLIILFAGGLSLNIRTVIAQLGKAVFLAFFAFGITMLIVLPVALYVMELEMLQSIILATLISGTASAIVIPVVTSLSLNDSLKTLISIESAISNLLILVIVVIACDLSVEGGNSGFGGIIWAFLVKIFVSVFSAVVAGVLWGRLIGSLKEESLSYMLTLGFIFLMNYLVDQAGGSGPISILFFAVILANVSQIVESLGPSLKRTLGIQVSSSSYVLNEFLKGISKELSFLVGTFFFVYLGVLVNFDELNPDVALNIGLLVLAIVVGRVISLILFRRFSPGKWIRAELILAIAMMPRGLATAVMAFKPIEYEIAGTAMFPFYAMIAILGSNLVMTALVAIGENGLSRYRRRVADQKSRKDGLEDTGPELAAAGVGTDAPADPLTPTRRMAIEESFGDMFVGSGGLLGTNTGYEASKKKDAPDPGLVDEVRSLTGKEKDKSKKKESKKGKEKDEVLARTAVDSKSISGKEPETLQESLEGADQQPAKESGTEKAVPVEGNGADIASVPPATGEAVTADAAVEAAEEEDIRSFSERLHDWLGLNKDSFAEMDRLTIKSLRIRKLPFWVSLTGTILFGVISILMGRMEMLLAAMLFSPVTQLLHTISFSLITGDVFIFLKSNVKLILVVAVSIGLSALLAYVIPFWGVPEEVGNLVRPTVLDYALSFCLGLIMPVMLLRNRRLELVAVNAIVALMIFPPLLVVGYGVGAGILTDLISGGLLAFAANFTALVVGAFLTHSVLGTGKSGTSQLIRVYKEQEVEEGILHEWFERFRLVRFLENVGNFYTRVLVLGILVVALYVPLQITINRLQEDFRVQQEQYKINTSALALSEEFFEKPGRSGVLSVKTTIDQDDVITSVRIQTNDYFEYSDIEKFEETLGKQVGKRVKLELGQSYTSLSGSGLPVDPRLGASVNPQDDNIATRLTGLQSALAGLEQELPNLDQLNLKIMGFRSSFGLGKSAPDLIVEYVKQAPLNAEAEVLLRTAIARQVNLPEELIRFEHFPSDYSSPNSKLENFRDESGSFKVKALLEKDPALSLTFMMPESLSGDSSKKLRAELLSLYPVLADTQRTTQWATTPGDTFRIQVY